MPAIPHSAAGPRMEPPVSEPVPPRISPAATAAPVPLLDPAVKCLGFHGLHAGGQGRSKDGPPKANSCVASLPSSTVPASASLAAAVASAVGTLLSLIHISEPTRLGMISYAVFCLKKKK